MTVLRRFGIAEYSDGKVSIGQSGEPGEVSATEIVWNAAKSEPMLIEVVRYLNEHPQAENAELGHIVNEKYGRALSQG